MLYPVSFSYAQSSDSLSVSSNLLDRDSDLFQLSSTTQGSANVRIARRLEVMVARC